MDCVPWVKAGSRSRTSSIRPFNDVDDGKQEFMGTEVQKPEFTECGSWQGEATDAHGNAAIQARGESAAETRALRCENVELDKNTF